MPAKMLTYRGYDLVGLVLLGLLAAAIVLKIAALASPGDLDLPALYGPADVRR